MLTDLDFSSPKFDFLFISLSQRRWCKCNISSAKIPSEMEVAPRYKLLTQASTLQTETLFFLSIFPLKGVSSHNLNRPNWSKFTPPSQGGWSKYRFLAATSCCHRSNQIHSGSNQHSKYFEMCVTGICFHFKSMFLLIELLVHQMHSGGGLA